MVSWNIAEKFVLFGFIFLQLVLFTQAGPVPQNVPENPRVLEPKEKWTKFEQTELVKAIRRQNNYGVAKNLILFIGDGMGMSTVTAMRILKGQNKGKPGEEERLNFEEFPTVGLANVYATDRQIPESAATASAILSGVKTRYNLVGFDDTVKWAKCSTESKEAELPSIRDWAEDAGKSTGIVTTSRISHSTPAAAYAKSASRYWEDDSNLPDDAKGKCKDIAAQLIDRGRNIDVILGGGRRNLLPKEAKDPVDYTKRGRRQDGRDLLKEWRKDKEERGKVAKPAWTKAELDKIDVSKTDYLLGLFANSHMSFEHFRDKDKEPSIAEMTRKAIEMLQKNDKGFFLLVEGARIDSAHHEGRARLAIEDGLAFELAVEEALKMTDPKDTQIVVTADHSHVFMMSGYPPRGNPLFGLTTALKGEDKEPATDKMPYTTIVYGNGPGYAIGPNGRANITGKNTEDPNYKAQAAVPVVDETHSAEDVPVYAQGPMAHLLDGYHDNSYIAHVMAYAACIGPNKNHCDKPVTIKINGLACVAERFINSASDLKISFMAISVCILIGMFKGL